VRSSSEGPPGDPRFGRPDASRLVGPPVARSSLGTKTKTNPHTWTPTVGALFLNRFTRGSPETDRLV